MNRPCLPLTAKLNYKGRCSIWSSRTLGIRAPLVRTHDSRDVRRLVIPDDCATETPFLCLLNTAEEDIKSRFSLIWVKSIGLYVSRYTYRGIRVEVDRV